MFQVKGVAEEVKVKGREAHYYVVDCSKRQEVYEAASRVEQEVGVVSVLVNNAGIVTGKLLLEAKDEKIEKTFAVNTLAHYWVCVCVCVRACVRGCACVCVRACVRACVRLFMMEV